MFVSPAPCGAASTAVSRMSATCSANDSSSMNTFSKPAAASVGQRSASLSSFRRAAFSRLTKIRRGWRRGVVRAVCRRHAAQQRRPEPVGADERQLAHPQRPGCVERPQRRRVYAELPQRVVDERRPIRRQQHVAQQAQLAQQQQLRQVGSQPVRVVVVHPLGYPRRPVKPRRFRRPQLFGVAWAESNLAQVEPAAVGADDGRVEVVGASLVAVPRHRRVGDRGEECFAAAAFGHVAEAVAPPAAVGGQVVAAGHVHGQRVAPRRPPARSSATSRPACRGGRSARRASPAGRAASRRGAGERHDARPSGSGGL